MNKSTLLTTGLKNVVSVLFMYIFSISLTFYNKWVVKSFHFPLSVSVVHYAVVFVMTAITRRIWEYRTGEKRVILEWSVYVKRVSPTAIATALDIGLSNWSLMFITISLYTMCKSTSIVFLLLFSLIFGLEKFHYLLCIIVLLISGGLFMFTYKSTQFNLTGFLLVISAAVIGGIRWTTTQILLQKKSWGLCSPFDTIYHLQPLMTLVLLPLAIGIEGEKLAVSVHLFRAPSSDVIVSSVFIILFGAVQAFMLNIAEYLVLANTSSLTLAVAGIFKELCVILIAAKFAGDEMDFLKFCGLVVTLLGITLHVVRKLTKEEKNYSENQDSKEKVRMVDSCDSSDEF